MADVHQNHLELESKPLQLEGNDFTPFKKNDPICYQVVLKVKYGSHPKMHKHNSKPKIGRFTTTVNRLRLGLSIFNCFMHD